jgi:CRP-like cAMP-binding protein
MRRNYLPSHWLIFGGLEGQMSRANHLLAALGPDLERLLPHMRDVEIHARRILCEPGDELRTVYFLHNGLVSKLAVFEDGAEIECVVVGREGAVGAMTALGLRMALTRDICHWDAKASAIEVSALRAAMERSPRISEVMHRYCVWKMSCAIRNGACNAIHSVEQRLARWILTCCDELGEDEIRLSQDILGKMLGVQRTSVNPNLQKFRTEGLIDLKRSHILLTDRATLTNRACSCYAELIALRQDNVAERDHNPRRHVANEWC